MCLRPAAEVSKTAVTVVPGVSCCMPSWFLRAVSTPCSQLKPVQVLWNTFTIIVQYMDRTKVALHRCKPLHIIISPGKRNSESGVTVSLLLVMMSGVLVGRHGRVFKQQIPP